MEMLIRDALKKAYLMIMEHISGETKLFMKEILSLGLETEEEN